MKTKPKAKQNQRRTKVAGTKLNVKGGCVRKTADWSYLKIGLGVQGWGEGPLKRCCYKCKATIRTMTDVVESAIWRTTLLTHAMYMADCRELGAYISALFELPFFDYDFITVDMMHCGPLGLNQYLLGCIIYELFRYELRGRITLPNEELQHLRLLIRQASKAVGLPQPAINKLTMPMIKGKGLPKLKIKASESMNLLKCMEHILAHYFPLETNHQQVRLHCVKNFNEMYRHIKDWVGHESGVGAAKSCRKGLLLMAELQRTCLEQRLHHATCVFLYNFYPKCTLRCIASKMSFASMAVHSPIGAFQTRAKSERPPRWPKAFILRSSTAAS